MNAIPAPIRIEPAYSDRERIRAMFARNGPYRTLATFAPTGLADKAPGEGTPPVPPWFRADWALEGKALVEGAELILHNESFLAAARAAFGTSLLRPEFVAVNINAPSPASSTHVDNPSFYGATRTDYPLPLLRVMGFSSLFETWRVVRASTLTWFYDGPGGSFDYWPDGIDGAMRSEEPPFGNIGLCGDYDRTYHRIGAIGRPGTTMPRMSAAAQIQPGADGNWVISENGAVVATYPRSAVRLSLLWKAEVGRGNAGVGDLSLDRIMTIFMGDLRRRGIDFVPPCDPLRDTAWALLLQRVYAPPVPLTRET